MLGLLGALDPYKHTQHQRNEKRSKMGTPTSKPMDKKSQGTGQCLGGWALRGCQGEGNDSGRKRDFWRLRM